MHISDELWDSLDRFRMVDYLPADYGGRMATQQEHSTLTLAGIDEYMAALSHADREGVDSHGYDAREMVRYLLGVDEVNVMSLALIGSCQCGRPALTPVCDYSSDRTTENYTEAIIHAGGDPETSPCLAEMATSIVAPGMTKIAPGVYVSGNVNDVNVEEVSPGVTRITRF